MGELEAGNFLWNCLSPHHSGLCCEERLGSVDFQETGVLEYSSVEPLAGKEHTGYHHAVVERSVLLHLVDRMSILHDGLQLLAMDGTERGQKLNSGYNYTD